MAALDSSIDLLQAVYQELKTQFGFEAPQGPPVTCSPEEDGGLLAYQILNTPTGPACVEVHQTPAEAPLEIWVCVPRPGVEGRASGGYSWFRYHRQPGGSRIVPDGGPLQICPPYAPWPGETEPQPPLARDGDWAYRQRYLVKQVLFEGADPPHWSPILVLTDEPQPFIGAIHARMQDPSTRPAAQALLDRARPAAHGDLTVRGMSNWQPVTLRGLAVRSSFTQNDFALDHAVGYIRPARGRHLREVPNGHLWNGDARDPDWPGLDWHIDVQPDPDMLYLASPGDPKGIAVEIEHFALPADYRPQQGDWLQVTGRWVIDCGHVQHGHTDADGFLTEVHPSELVVAGRPDPNRAHGSMARVLATGAWQGFPLSFVVYPPPRPSADAKLRWAIEDEWSKRATLTLTPWPADANHLIGTLQTDDPTSLVVQPNGMVGMTDTRGYHALVKCWWEAPSARVEGRVMHDAAPARGSRVFYRAANVGPAPWLEVAVDEAGGYAIPALAPGAYWLRPAGPAWDFAGVPQQVDIAPGTRELSFIAAPAAPQATGPTDDLSAFPLHREETQDWHDLLHADKRVALKSDQPLTLHSWTFDPRILQDPAAQENPAGSPTGDHLDHIALGSRVDLDLEARQVPAPDAPIDDPAVASALADAVLTIISPSGMFGVRDNRLGYADTARLSVHLAQLDDGSGRPITAADRAVSRVRIEEVDPAGRACIIHDVVQIHGVNGPGLAGATIRARLWLASLEGGYQAVSEATGETDANGIARFEMQAGTHVAEAVLTLEVTANPANPWLLPKVRMESNLFAPAASGDDSLPPEPYVVRAVVESADSPDGKQEAKLKRLDAKRQDTRATLQSLSPDSHTVVRDRLATGLEVLPPEQLAAGAGIQGEIAQPETVTRSTFPGFSGQARPSPGEA